MTKMHVKKGDTVKVISGEDRGKVGEVKRSIPSQHRVVVEKVNMMKKAMRPTQQNPQGGISTMEAPLDASNVMLVCPRLQRGHPRGSQAYRGWQAHPRVQEVR